MPLRFKRPAITFSSEHDPVVYKELEQLIVQLDGLVTEIENNITTVIEETATRVITFIIFGAAAPITTGVKGDVFIPFDCTITAATLLADQTGSIEIDIWRDTYGNYPPTVADTIVASAPPEIVSGVKSQDNGLVGWSKTINAGNTLRFNVNSCTDIERVTLALTVQTS